MASNVALVTGANGVSGNAIIEHLIRQPKDEWSRIIVSSRRPLPIYWQDPRVEFVPIDFLDPLESIIKQLRPLCKDVTHAYYTSYVHVDDFVALKKANIPLFENFLNAVTAVAQNLQRICLQTGTKHYGCHLGPVRIPVDESLPRYEDRGDNFYYQQEDYLIAAQKKANWSYNIIRPHAIVGFTPQSNGMSQAITAAMYFLVCRELKQPGLFPGNEFIYNSFDDCSHAPSLADLTVWTTTQENCKNEDFVHCNGDVYMWKYFWPALASFWGLEIGDVKFTKAKGAANISDNEFSMIDWAADKKPVWETICKKYGGKPEAFDWGTWGFFNWSLGKSWPTVASTAKARKFGWKRIDNTYEAWLDTFRAFSNAGILPRQSAVLDYESSGP